MLQLALILFLLACTVLIAHSSVVIFLCCVTGTACSCWLLVSFVRGTRQLRITWLLAAGLLLGYCAGVVASQLIYALAGLDAISIIGIDSHYVSWGLMLVFISCGGLVFAGSMETPLFRDLPLIEFDAKIERFIWLYLILIAAAFVHGDFSYEATNFVEGGQKISALAGICSAAGIVLPPLATLGFVQASGLRRLRLGVLTLLAFGALVPVSRRDVLYSGLVTVYCVAQLSGRKFHMSRLRKTLLGVTAFVVFMVSSLLFFGVRATGAQEAHGASGEKVTFVEAIAAARSGILAEPRVLFSAMGDNIEDRAFVIGYLSLLARGGHGASPMLGQDALFSIKISIPDFLYDVFGVDKDPIRSINAEEGLANEHFGLNVTDEANSILTAGLIDFGLVGIVLYPILLCFLCRKFMHLMQYFVSARIYLIIGLLTVCIFLQTEMELKVYVLFFRNVLMLAVGCAILFSLPTVVRSRREMRALGARSGALDAALRKG